MTPTERRAAHRPGPPSPELTTLHGEQRGQAAPSLEEGFTGIYRWHAKRTLRTVESVRAAVVDGRVAGVALLDRPVPEVGYVYYLAVGSAFRRQGIGGLLLDDALERFRVARVSIVYGAVEEGNSPSERLFRSRGFRVIERGERNWRDGGLGAEGLRSRMWVVRGERLFGRRIAVPEEEAPRSGGTAAGGSVGTGRSSGAAAPREWGIGREGS